MQKVIKLLKSPLDNGETWENKSKRIIEISLSSDIKPTVYFGIFKKKHNEKNLVVVEDFFLTPKTATKIANQLLEIARQIKQYL